MNFQPWQPHLKTMLHGIFIFLLITRTDFKSNASEVSQMNGEAAPAAYITNAMQMWQKTSSEETACLVNVKGTVLATFPLLSKVLLRDESGIVPVQLDLSRHPLKPGQLVRLSGFGRLVDGTISFSPLQVVNDGLHLEEEVGATGYLSEGMNPIQVDYFQGTGASSLRVSWLRPDGTREVLPAGDLCHWEQSATGRTNLAAGLEFAYFEGVWGALPDFTLLTPVKLGGLSQFGFPSLTRRENFGLRIRGFVRVPQSGIYTLYIASNDGSRLSVGQTEVQVEVLNDHVPLQVEDPRPINLGQRLSKADAYAWSSAQGVLGFARRVSGGWEGEIHSESGRMELHVEGATNAPVESLVGHTIRTTGFCRQVVNAEGESVAGAIWVPSPEHVRIAEGDGLAEVSDDKTTATNLPLLTTAIQIHNLSATEAARGYPVRLRGVITHRSSSTFGVIQDSTSGIYLTFSNAPAPALQVGDFCEVVGMTDPGKFAPIVQAGILSRLGKGQFPVPLHPDYAQLIGGSADHQWVEFQGMVTELLPGGEFRIAIKGGRVRAGFTERPNPEQIAGLSNAIVRVRGCALTWFNKSRQIIGDVFVAVPSMAFLSLEQVAPRNPSEIPFQKVAELTQFNPGMNGVRRVAVQGQITYVSDNAIYLIQDGRGLRLFPRDRQSSLALGDWVDVLGLLEISGSLPTLRESTIQKTGHAPLPAPERLLAKQLFDGKLNSSRVEVVARLIGSRYLQDGLILQLESDLRSFEAYCLTNINLAEIPKLGSEVAVCGIVTQQERPGGGANAPVLLLSSTRDITCIKPPPRWTLREALVLISVLATAIFIAGLWIALLHRTVERRSQALRSEMEERRQAEAGLQAMKMQADMEEQRARIARNIHDDLGARATKLTRLADRVRQTNPDAETELADISKTSQEMVEALDETVWTVNPANDILTKLGDYISHYAEDFFRGTGMRCELDISLDLPELTLTAELRYNLFLLVKEALNNALKHSQARNVFLKMTLSGDQLEIIVRDDGKGFDQKSPSSGNGLVSMKSRAQGFCGNLQLETAPGKGTIVRITLPLTE